MLLSVSLVLWTAVLGPVLYVVYVLASWTLDAYRRGKVLSQFPNEPRHWLWGHLHLVSFSLLLQNLIDPVM